MITPKVNDRLIKKYADAASIKKNIQPRLFKSPYIWSQLFTFLIVISCFFYHDYQIFKCGNNAEYKKNQKKPWIGVKFSIQIMTYEGADGDAQGHRHAYSAQVAQVSDGLFYIIVH